MPGQVEMFRQPAGVALGSPPEICAGPADAAARQPPHMTDIPECNNLKAAAEPPPAPRKLTPAEINRKKRLGAVILHVLREGERLVGLDQAAARREERKCMRRCGEQRLTTVVEVSCESRSICESWVTV